MLILDMAARHETRRVLSSKPPLGRGSDAILVSMDGDTADTAQSGGQRQRQHQQLQQQQHGTPLKKRLSRTDVRMLGARAGDTPKRMACPGRVPQHHQAGPPIKIEQVQVRRKPNRQRTFSGFVQKHLFSLKKLSTQQSLDSSTEVTTIYSSCPDLVDEHDVLTSPSGLKTSRSTDGSFGQEHTRNGSGSPSDGSRSTSPKLLTVPSVFTTSMTHSKPHVMRSRTDSVGGRDMVSTIIPTSTREHYRHSAPDLMTTQSELIHQAPAPKPKPSLTKSYSDVPPMNLKTSRSSSTTGSLKDYCSEPHVSKITDLLYIGNLEAAYHERLLCKLAISSLVDLSNMQPEEVPASKKCSIPCSCDSTLMHTPATLRLGVCESDLIEIQSHFPKINRFIEGAVQRNKKVMIMCYTGTGLSVLVMLQYLMHHKNMCLRKAYSQVMKQRSDLELSAVYRDLLLVLDRQLYPGEQGHPASPCSLSSAQGFFPKEAWTDS